MSRSALVLCSHGTADPSGQAAVSALVAAVRARAVAEVLETWVDVQQPQVGQVVSGAVAQGFSPVTIVPLLLSAGYHVHVDIARAAAAYGVRTAGALGPDARLADLVAQRLEEAGAVPDDVVVLAAAGSSDERAVADVTAVIDHLRTRWDGPVRAGYGSKAAPSVPDAVAAARAAHPGRRVVVAGYLLAPGFFHDRLAAAGADLVTDPLVPVRARRPVVDDRLVQLVLERARTA